MPIKPIRTEKSLKEGATGRYTFGVDLFANKTDIKRKLEKMFNINIVKVQTTVVPGKTYKTGKKYLIARRSDWKKATVTVKSGQKIDLFETA